MTELELMGDVRVLVWRRDSRLLLRDERDAVDAIGEARSLDAEWAAVPVELLGTEFFDLRTGVAGAVMQKFAQYGVGLALVGDVAARVTVGTALGALIRECNRGFVCWFVEDLGALRDRIGCSSDGPG